MFTMKFCQVALQKCCTVAMMKEVQKGLLDQALQQSRTWKYLLFCSACKETQAKQITRHETVTREAMTKLKLRYKHNYRIKICKPHDISHNPHKLRPHRQDPLCGIKYGLKC